MPSALKKPQTTFGHSQFRLHRTSRSDISQAKRMHSDPHHALAYVMAASSVQVG